MDESELSARCVHAYTRYGRACDANDVEALRRLAVDDVRFTINGPVHKTGAGIEAFLDLFRTHPADRKIRHAISAVVAHRDGEDVSSTAYFEATVFEESSTRVTYGSYRNVFREAHDGTLLIAHQVIDVDRHLTLAATVPVTGAA